ncbi:MAG: ATP-grasp domain-containing protein [Candidatus Thorarchaeota archaeon]
MKGPKSSLRGKNIGVVGFNARPIACSLKRLGAYVIVSDYWGDADLDPCCDEWTSVLKATPGERQRQHQETAVPQALVANLLAVVGKRDLDGVFVGSGFDDASEELKPFVERDWIIGNSPVQMRKARDRSRLHRLAAKQGVRMPFSGIARSLEEVVDLAGEVGYPLVVRPLHSGGGSGIRLIQDEGALLTLLATRDPLEVVIQEYVRGLDVSSSVLSTGRSARVLSVQGQLIGTPSAGRNCDFVYCGNYLPVRLERDATERIRRVSEEISMALKLVGSNGLDFVVGENGVWLMEVNPRIQGTLELLERAGNVSVSDLHYRAVIDQALPTEVSFNAGVKLIVYARRVGAVPDLGTYATTVDRSPQGVVVSRGDPICSVIKVGAVLSDCYLEATVLANTINSLLGPVS